MAAQMNTGVQQYARVEKAVNTAQQFNIVGRDFDLRTLFGLSVLVAHGSLLGFAN